MFTNLHKFLIVTILTLTFLSITVISFADKQSTTPQQIQTPGDWVKEDQIKVYPNQIILNVKDATWAKFTDTHSMDPVLDKTTNTLEIKPTSPNDIKMGDIIAYSSADGIIIHRVIEKNIDNNGIYFLVKGDNNPTPDPTKVRFEDIQGVVIAIIY